MPKEAKCDSKKKTKKILAPRLLTSLVVVASSTFFLFPKGAAKTRPALSLPVRTRRESSSLSRSSRARRRDKKRQRVTKTQLNAFALGRRRCQRIIRSIGQEFRLQRLFAVGSPFVFPLQTSGTFSEPWRTRWWKRERNRSRYGRSRGCGFLFRC